MRDRAIIDALTYDVNPPLILEIQPDSEVFNGLRRVTRTATLDGESVFPDGGYSNSDRTLTLLVLSATETQLIQLNNLQENFDFVTIAVRSGMFKCKFRRFSTSGTRTNLTFYVVERMDV